MTDPIQWRIYYWDETTADNRGGRPRALGVICIAVVNPSTGIDLVREFDHYWFDGMEWFGADTFGILDNLAQGIMPVYYCRGTAVSKKLYREIIERALDDPDTPRKSAHQKCGETPRRNR